MQDSQLAVREKSRITKLQRQSSNGVPNIVLVRASTLRQHICRRLARWAEDHAEDSCAINKSSSFARNAFSRASPLLSTLVGKWRLEYGRQRRLFGLARLEMLPKRRIDAREQATREQSPFPPTTNQNSSIARPCPPPRRHRNANSGSRPCHRPPQKPYVPLVAVASRDVTEHSDCHGPVISLSRLSSFSANGVAGG
jgi:hypothetical protein